MCGIAGFIGTRRIDPKRIDSCLRAMNHRGPDASGHYTHALRDGRHVHLLHTRLAIIDLGDRANQPARFESKVFVFNGELYNYREIQSARGWDGRQLATKCDTEVLLRVLAEDGWPGLELCDGMWAFALFDEETETLMLSRDRFGEKPLYIHRASDGIYFGSEIKFIFALRGGRLPIDRGHVQRYLVNGYKSLYKTGAGFFESVEELRPGTALTIGPKQETRSHRYWKPCFDRDESLTYEQVVAETREALIRSVELRLRADVPLAFLLSGGVDSNTLIGIARRELDYDVHAFTIVSEDERYDERTLVDHSVRSLDLEHTAISVDTSRFLERLRALVRARDAPVYMITYYAQWLLHEAIAQRGYRIAISGTGADELFSGYYDHHNAYLYEVRSDPDRYPVARAAWEQHIRPIVRNPHLSDPELFIRNPDFRDHIFLDADAFSACLTQPWSEPFAETRYCEGLLRNRMLNELFHEAVPPILHEDDHNAMSHSIENRSPFLDRHLFDVCQRIPTRYLVRDGFAKAILRDAARTLAPDAILDERRKVGFNAPIRSYLGEAPTVRAEVLADGPIFEIVRRDAIEALLDHPHLPNSRSKFLFYFLSAKMFMEEFAA